MNLAIFCSRSPGLRSTMSKIIILFFVLFGTALQAQNSHWSPSALLSLKGEYPNDDAVYLLWQEHLKIGWKDRELDITRDHDSRLLFLQSGGLGLAERSVHYSGFSEILHLDAATQVPIRDKYRKTPVSEIRDLHAISGGIFYDDRRKKSFVFPSVSAGALGELQYTERIHEPRFLGAFHFRNMVPVQRAEYIVTVDTGIQLGYVMLGRDTSGIVFDISTQGALRSYRWTAEKQPAMILEDQAPSILSEEPHVVVYLSKAGGKRILGDPSGLYAWYRQLTDTINRHPDPQILSLTGELTADANTGLEKAQRIYGWVQDNIRYVAFEEGLGGFVPREASLVCQRKYGDCKDMSSLLNVMLQAAGIPSGLTWIGTRDIPYSYEEVPTPLVDNHMIVTAWVEGEPIFLDATDERLGFGYPSSFIQGKQALVGKGADFELIEVPVVRAVQNRVESRLQLLLSEDVLQGSARLSYQGYPSFELRSRLHQQRPETETRFLSALLAWGNNKFSLKSHSISNRDERNKPLEFDIEYVLPDYVRKTADHIYLNMQLDRSLENSLINIAQRKRDREFEYRRENAMQVSFRIPDGYAVEHLPSSAESLHEDFGFSIRYEILDSVVIMEREIRVDTLRLGSSDFEAWNQMVKAYQEACTDVLVLSPVREGEGTE